MTIKDDDPKGGRRGAGGAALGRKEATVVTVRVPRFLKHPSGHTVYACCVEMPHTRQVRYDVSNVEHQQQTRNIRIHLEIKGKIDV